jgi:voltage-gated potassium channel Kch
MTQLNRRHRVLLFLTGLVSLVLGYSMAGSNPVALKVLDISYLLVLSYGPFTVYGNRQALVRSLTFGVPAAILTYHVITNPSSAVFQAAIFSWILFNGSCAWWLAQDLNRQDYDGPEHLYAGIATYLLVGTTFAAVHALVYSLDVQAYKGLDSANEMNTIWVQMIYFSFVTLTSTGYGDILPATPLARFFAVVEAVMGMLVVAILISRLVSAIPAGHTARSGKKRRTRVPDRISERPKDDRLPPG